MKNTITYYFILDVHLTTFFSSHSGHCILVLSCTSYQPVVDLGLEQDSGQKLAAKKN
jgi:hypothetical protein